MSEIDPDLGAAWRAASGEQPPAALDDSIRAAARREVGAKPGRLRGAPRWWPLAAAATVAAVAVGIVQMTPPEQVTPAAFPPATNAARQEVTPDAMKPADSAQKRDAIATQATANEEAERGALREEAKAPAKDQRNRAVDETNAGATSGAGSFATPPGAPARDKKATLQSPAQPEKETTDRDQAAKQKTELAASLSVARQSANAVTSAAPPSRSEVRPFPASPVPAEAGASNAPPPMTAAAPAPPAPPTPRADAAAAPTAPSTSAPALAPAPAATPAPASAMASRKLAAQSSPPSPPAMAESAGNAQPGTARTSLALGKVAPADADKSAPEGRKDTVPLAPDEWIKRIRRLIADGKNEDAAKELDAFRREYKERSESLLPSDLRTFRP